MITLSIAIIIESGKLLIIAGKCPSSRVLHPCDCFHNRITCGGKLKYSLKHIFRDTSDNLTKNEKRFKDFIFQNKFIEEFEDNLFSDISFENITIRNAVSLKRITSNAFNNTAKSVIVFDQRGETKLGKKYVHQLFDALSSLVNVKIIILELNQLKTFPTYAFRNINGKQLKLEKLSIHSKSMNKISNYAFYELPNLKYLTINANKILKIFANSFDFEMPSNNLINIDLQNNKLNGSSFELEAFLGTKRAINLMLMFNEMTYLDEQIFEPLFNSDSRNIINLEGNPLLCDCRMFWLIREKDIIQNQLKNAICNNFANIWSLDEKYFAKCNIDFNYAPKLVIKSLSFKVRSNAILIEFNLFLIFMNRL